MSFKKFFAPVVLCCCAVSSLSSYCSATYEYSDLYAVEITEYKGLNGTSDIDKLDNKSRIVYVSKELENLLKKGDRKCANCQKSIELSEGFVVAHDTGSLHWFDNAFDISLDRVLKDERINENSSIVKGFISHLICKQCTNIAIQSRPLIKNKDPHRNGLLRCPFDHSSFCDSVGGSLRRIRFLGEAAAVQRKKNLKDLFENLCIAGRISGRVLISGYAGYLLSNLITTQDDPYCYY